MQNKFNIYIRYLYDTGFDYNKITNYIYNSYRTKSRIINRNLIGIRLIKEINET